MQKSWQLRWVVGGGALLASLGGAGSARAQALPSPHALGRPVPLGEARIIAAPLRRRVLGNASDAPHSFFWPNYTTPGNQVGQLIALSRPGWLEAISFRVVACSYDSLFFRVQVYTVAEGFPAAPLLPQTVAVRLARAQLASRVVLDLRPYHLRLAGDAVVALEFLRAQGPGTVAFSAAQVPGPCYKIDLPGDSTSRNLPPRGTRTSAVPWQPGPPGPWQRATSFSLGFTATVLQELP